MDEQQFRKIIIQIRALAKSQGEAISKEQVHNRFLPLNVSEGQFLLIYKYLNEEKVKLYETEEERLKACGEQESPGEFSDASVTPSKSASGNSGNSSKIRISREDSDYLKMYIDELNDMDLPSDEERESVIGSVLNDRDSAIRLLPQLFLSSVVDVARLYSGQGVAVEDLIGEGNIGVLTAAGMLDTCETVPEVEEFMMRMIMDSMEALIMNSLNDDEFDLRIAERVNELNDKAREMAEELERLVTVEELVNELEADEEYIRETIRLSGNSIEYIKI